MESEQTARAYIEGMNTVLAREGQPTISFDHLTSIYRAAHVAGAAAVSAQPQPEEVPAIQRSRSTKKKDA